MLIGNVRLDTPVMLAPMAGSTDVAFRETCFSMGCGYACTEMVSAKALCFRDKKTKTLLARGALEGPLAVQIFGSDPDTMAEGARLALEGSGADVVDINMGCPMPKIVKNGDGSALMKAPGKAAAVIRAVCRASPAPVTVKFRAGWDADHINAPEFAKMAEDAGAAALTIHGRTTAQLYSGRASRDVIRAVCDAVTVPVFANGDICSGQDALDLLSQTGAAGLAVGRGAEGNPWLFREIYAALAGEAIPSPPGIEERLSVALRQITRAAELKGERMAILEARHHLVRYLKGIRGAAAFRAKAAQVSSLAEAAALKEEIIASLG